jgi:integrase/recombinase XerD
MSSELRTRFMDYMTLHRFSEHTKRSYMSSIEALTKFHDQSHDTLTNDQIQAYLLYLIKDRKLAWGSCNNYFSGIICFYKNVCKWMRLDFTSPLGPGLRNYPLF